jgi:hypothetical protein
MKTNSQILCVSSAYPAALRLFMLTAERAGYAEETQRIFVPGSYCLLITAPFPLFLQFS